MDHAGDIQNCVDNFFLTFRSFKYSKLSHLSLQMKDEQRHGTLQLSQLSITIFLKQKHDISDIFKYQISNFICTSFQQQLFSNATNSDTKMFERREQHIPTLPRSP
jgi:hypothetical protein